MKTLQLNDFLQYRFLSSLKYAPGGKRAAFAVSVANEEENCYESVLWLYDGGLRQLTGLGSERSFIWEDETHILFPAVRSAKEKKRKEAGEALPPAGWKRPGWAMWLWATLTPPAPITTA